MDRSTDFVQLADRIEQAVQPHRARMADQRTVDLFSVLVGVALGLNQGFSAAFNLAVHIFYERWKTPD